jgi:sodium/potassium-transporting ATPase subunit alpha
VPFSDIVLAYGGYKGDLSAEFVAEQVNRAQSVYFFTLIVCLFFSRICN